MSAWGNGPNHCFTICKCSLTSQIRAFVSSRCIFSQTKNHLWLCAYVLHEAQTKLYKPEMLLDYLYAYFTYWKHRFTNQNWLLTMRIRTWSIGNRILQTRPVLCVWDANQKIATKNIAWETSPTGSHSGSMVPRRGQVKGCRPHNPTRCLHRPNIAIFTLLRNSEGFIAHFVNRD